MSVIWKYRTVDLILSFLVILLTIPVYSQPLPGQIDSLIKLTASSKSDTEKVNDLIAISELYTCADSAKKNEYLNRALQLARSANWKRGIMRANMSLGTVSVHCLRDNGRSINYFRQALLLARDSRDSTYEAMILASMAYSYKNLLRYGTAINYYKEALTINSNPEMALGIMGNMGYLYNLVNDYPRALACYDSSLKILEDLTRSSKEKKENFTLQMAGLLISIGDIYMAMPAYNKALENFEAAKKISEQTKNRALEIWSLMGIAKAYHAEGNDSIAIKHYLAALKECQVPVEDSRDEITIICELGNLYFEKGDVNAANSYAQSGLTMANSSNLSDQLPCIYSIFGKIYTKQHNYALAVDYLQKAVKMFGQNSALDAEKDAWETLSNTYELMNEPAKALDAYRHFITIRDSIYNITRANELTRIDLQSEYGRRQISDSLKQSAEYMLKIQKQKVYTYTGYAGLIVVLLLSFFIYRNYSHQKKANIAISKANQIINDEKQVSEKLLLNILPEEVARELKAHGNVQAKLFDHVTVLFTDFVNFSEAGERLSPQELVAELHTCFMAFDGIISKYDIEKIKTVGDAYLAVSGLPNVNTTHATEIVKAAIEIRDFMAARKQLLGDKTFGVRIGINSGTVVAGIVGVKKFAYDIWGDTVNIAARMQQYSEPGKINISHSTYELVRDQFVCTDRGTVDAKNKGKMRMYFLEGSRST